jgi:adenine-specific DNA-methyltransferase
MMKLSASIDSDRLSGHRRSPAAKTNDYLFAQLIPYLGNKRKLLGLIDNAIQRSGSESGVFADLFAGSGVVSRLAKEKGFTVISNDWEPYAFEINNCFIGCSAVPKFELLGGAEKTLRSLNALEASPGWIASNLCPIDDINPDTLTERMFFTQANGAKIDAIREQIDTWERRGLINLTERSYLLAPLLFAASYVSNTSGVFKGFHNGWGGKTKTALYRILSSIELKAPVLWGNSANCQSWQLDAILAAERLSDEFGTIDIAYLDPPYNQHPYSSNYHVLNSIALWDKPEIRAGISRGQKSAIRTDWRTERRSAYNYRSGASKSFAELMTALKAKTILISYSTDGIIPLKEMIDICKSRGQLSLVMRPYKRYRVSAQRMSAKPMNVEFVLIVDTQKPAMKSSADVYDKIMASERTALDNHRLLNS